MELSALYTGQLRHACNLLIINDFLSNTIMHHKKHLVKSICYVDSAIAMTVQVCGMSRKRNC